MKMRNSVPPAFSVINLDSAVLAGTAVIAHQLVECGDWGFAVGGQEGQTSGTGIVRVLDGEGPFHAALDLGSPAEVLSLRKGGYLRIGAGTDGGGFVTLHGPEGTDEAWDSRRLSRGDLFAFLVFRPGSYLMTNEIGGLACEILVEYPDPRKNTAKTKPPFEPVRLSSAQIAKSERIRMKPGQGMVVDVESAARLTFVLRSADDGPPDIAEWRRTRQTGRGGGLTTRSSD
ncbi:hypothetical protein [Allomesorhizobium alhagi]|jgi:hypothetical protein|uniref:Uncharacterized protein n=1 Tax=Mesorhizobium alhagi CCNWXJ12-2 TaxID=1107882 RepID=H0I0D7_9HYPH|nr:hypothetical protein [Mesorhizobium alhagi]EHK53549.1 hypothetical protein MAXJ12_29697 [Mesorhizobium alhagi CCNWXJ12-2]